MARHQHQANDRRVFSAFKGRVYSSSKSDRSKTTLGVFFFVVVIIKCPFDIWLPTGYQWQIVTQTAADQRPEQLLPDLFPASQTSHFNDFLLLFILPEQPQKTSEIAGTRQYSPESMKLGPF